MTTLSDPGGHGGQKVPLALIQSLKVAGVEFTSIKAARHNLIGGHGACQGLLGFPLFRNYLLTLDYPNRRIALTSGSLAQDNSSAVLPFRMPYGVPIVPLHIGSLQIEAQLDSGGTGLTLPEQLVPQLKFATEPVDFINAHSLSGSFKIKSAQLASSVQLGEYIFPKPWVEIIPLFPVANFGSVPMQDFALTFDQKNLMVRLEARKKIHFLLQTELPESLVWAGVVTHVVN